MKTRQTVPARNLHKIFYILIGMSIVLCSFKTLSLTKSAHQNNGVHQMMSWISNTINSGKGYNFSEADGNHASIKNYDTSGFAAADSASLTSNYSYKVSLSLPASNVSTDMVALNTPKQSESNLSDVMANVPAELLAGMDPSQVKNISDLTSAMSAAQVISKLKDDKSFRQDIQNAGGSLISKDMYVLADNYK
jgi:hypothetical protein